jgi:hypothetical protein
MSSRHHVVAGNFDWSVEPIELSRVADERLVAVRAHVANDRRYPPIGGGVARALGCEKRPHRPPICRFNDPQHL